MRSLLIISAMLLSAACGGNVANNTSRVPPRSVESPMPTPVVPTDGDYKGRGKVMKIDEKAGSVEIDHEDIPGMMPAMRMEFNVADKSLLNNIKAGDQVDFTLRYKHPTETIVAITKAP